MMINRMVAIAALIMVTAVTCVASEEATQSHLNPVKAEAAKKYPRIVAYTVSWCPHCRAAKEYMTQHDIPFINKDVEIDAKAMDELTGKYQSQGVPVIVIGTGKDEVVLKGFTPELFEESLKKVQNK